MPCKKLKFTKGLLLVNEKGLTDKGIIRRAELRRKGLTREQATEEVIKENKDILKALKRR